MIVQLALRIPWGGQLYQVWLKLQVKSNQKYEYFILLKSNMASRGNGKKKLQLRRLP